MARTLFKKLQIKWWLFCGRREMARKRPAEAIRNFEKPLAIDPLPVIALAQIGPCLYDLEKYDESLETFRRAIERAPNYADVHARLGLTYMQLGRNREACDSNRRASRMRPKL